jgi:hypothetical protein
VVPLSKEAVKLHRDDDDVDGGRFHNQG